VSLTGDSDSESDVQELEPTTSSEYFKFLLKIFADSPRPTRLTAQ
jgi:hypothetical protein